VEHNFRRPPPNVPYWDDPRIHNFGNHNLLHAILVPWSLKEIDKYEYKETDIRAAVFKRIPQDKYPKVVDLCCGVGISTIPWGLGVDTSETMLNVAKCRSRSTKDSHKRFVIGNAETFGKDDSFDVVTCFLSTHEMPQEARIRVLKNAIRIATKKVIFVDIHPNYKPSRTMLSGEPYMLDF
jgi:ubiquinone/menaquinone biosynthesis C-methylase UbiE